MPWGGPLPKGRAIRLLAGLTRAESMPPDGVRAPLTSLTLSPTPTCANDVVVPRSDEKRGKIPQFPEIGIDAPDPEVGSKPGSKS